MSKSLPVSVLLMSLCASSAGYGQAPRYRNTSSFTSNQPLKDAVGALLVYVQARGIASTALSSAFAGTLYHKDVTDTASLSFDLRAENGYTLVPGGLVTHIGWTSWIYVSDTNTHTIHSAADSQQLLSRNYGTPVGSNGGVLLNGASLTALHELTHSVIYRTRCFKGTSDAEESLVQDLEAVFGAKAAGATTTFGQELATARAAGGDGCISILGLAPSLGGSSSSVDNLSLAITSAGVVPAFAIACSGNDNGVLYMSSVDHVGADHVIQRSPCTRGAMTFDAFDLNAYVRDSGGAYPTWMQYFHLPVFLAVKNTTVNANGCLLSFPILTNLNCDANLYNRNVYYIDNTVYPTLAAGPQFAFDGLTWTNVSNGSGTGNRRFTACDTPTWTTGPFAAGLLCATTPHPARVYGVKIYLMNAPAQNVNVQFGIGSSTTDLSSCSLTVNTNNLHQGFNLIDFSGVNCAVDPVARIYFSEDSATYHNANGANVNVFGGNAATPGANPYGVWYWSEIGPR